MVLRALLPGYRTSGVVFFAGPRRRKGVRKAFWIQRCTEMEVLQVDSVKKSFRGDMSFSSMEVLHGVSFSAGKGEILGFLGPNGAGKTTTIKIILGLLRADSGSVRIFGDPQGGRQVMRRVGYLPENPYIYPHLTLTEFLGYCADLSDVPAGVRSSRVSEAISLVGLEEHARRRTKGFSKGMLQRAGLAQAILHDPDLLILDEPFSGLDPIGRKTVKDILLDLKGKGKTIFFSSHILPDMEALCDRACIINEGTITRCIGLAEVFRIGEGMVEIAVRGCSQSELDPVSGYLDSVAVNGEELFLVVRKQELVRTVVQHLYNCGAEVLKVSNHHPSLEEVFLGEINDKRTIEKESMDKKHYAGQATGGGRR
jgi:ABC-2 type transport system ATP-binding protein